MPGIDFDVLRNEITIEQVLNLLGFTPSSVSRDQLRGPCPVHGSSSDQSRSFSVNVTKGRYYCFKCDSKGNQLELWAAVHRISI
jgi:DNA primase